jgi:hypothetical protein
MDSSLTPDEKSYLSQIAARAAAGAQKSGKPVTEGNLLELATKAHAELCAQRTDRSTRASKMLAATVWRNVQIRNIQQKVVSQALADAS